MMKKGNTNQQIRERAIRLVQDHSESQLKDYDEPVRAGTAKGDPIGFSYKKLHAAHLTILFPECLKLKEIADIVGVSEGVLRVWRTDEKFIQTANEFGGSLGKMIANAVEAIFYLYSIREGETEIIESDLDQKTRIQEALELEERFKSLGIDNPIKLMFEYFMYISFIPIAREAFLESIKKKDPRLLKRLGYIYVTKIECLITDSRTLKKVKIAMLEFTKEIIEIGINYLADPSGFREENQEDVKMVAEFLKEYISRELDILAE